MTKPFDAHQTNQAATRCGTCVGAKVIHQDMPDGTTRTHTCTTCNGTGTA